MLTVRLLRNFVFCVIAIALVGCEGNGNGNGIGNSGQLVIDNFEYSISTIKGLNFCPASSGGNIHGYVFYADNKSEHCPKKSGDSKRYISVWGDFNALNISGSEILQRNCFDMREGSQLSELFKKEGLFLPKKFENRICGDVAGDRVKVYTFQGLDSSKRSIFPIDSQSRPELFVTVRMATDKKNFSQDFRNLIVLVDSIAYH